MIIFLELFEDADMDEDMDKETEPCLEKSQ